MIALDERRKAEYREALKVTMTLLDAHVNDPALNKTETLRAIGHGVSLLLALGLDLLGGSGVDSGSDPRQLSLFQGLDGLSDPTIGEAKT